MAISRFLYNLLEEWRKLSSEDEELETPERTRKVVVQVEKPEDSDLRTKAGLYDELVNGMANTLNEKHGTDLFSNKSLEEMRKLDQLLDGREKPKQRSTGVVSLLRRQQTDNLLTKPYEDAEEFGNMVYKHANDPSSPIYYEANEAKNILLEKLLETGLPRTTDLTQGEERQAVKDLGTDFSHEQFTAWARRREKERLSGQRG